MICRYADMAIRHAQVVGAMGMDFRGTFAKN